MDNRHISEWKHATAPNGFADPVGVDLFDDEDAGQFSIYNRFADGTRYPARTVVKFRRGHAGKVLAAWAKRGTVNDYRSDKTPAVPQ